MSIKAKIAEELAQRVKGGDGIAMDFASRMQRAKEQGFDTDTVYYHGTNADFDEFKRSGGGEFGKGVYLTKDPKVAKAYGNNVHEVFVSGRLKPITKKKWLDTRGYQTDKNKIYDRNAKDGEWKRSWVTDAEDWIERTVNKRGYSGIYEKNPEYPAMDQGIVYNPKNIRSVNAAFDPAKKDSSNLLASMGAGTAAGAGLLASDDSEAGVVSGIFSKGDDLARKADFITNMQASERIPATDEGFSLQESWLNYIDDPIANKEAESLDLTLSELSDKYKKDIAMQVNDPNININSVLDNYSKISSNFDNFLKNAQGLNNEAAFQAKTLLNQRGKATPRDMAVGTGAGLTSVALADAYQDYMAKDKALADESLFNFGRMVEQAPQNLSNAAQDVAMLGLGLGDLARGASLPYFAATGDDDGFIELSDNISAYEEPKTQAASIAMDSIADLLAPPVMALAPYYQQAYDSYGSSESPDDYKSPYLSGAKNMLYDLSRGVNAAAASPFMYASDKLDDLTDYMRAERIRRNR